MSVYCVLEVKNRIPSVTVYMELDSVDKNLTDLSYLTFFLSFFFLQFKDVMLKNKQGTGYLDRNNVHFPNIILCTGVCERVCLVQQ